MQTSKWLDQAARLSLLGALIFFSAVFYGSLSQSREEVAPLATQSTAKPIEDVRLGERIIGRNPNRSEAEAIEPDQATWRAISLVMHKPGGEGLSIELLRSVEWIEQYEAVAGNTIFIDLHEMGAVGEANVLAISPCPEIKPGQGAIVTGTFKHEVSPQTRVIRLQLEDQAESTVVTDNHPYWSVDRTDFIPAGELHIGENVDSAAGPKRVAAVTEIAYSGFLHNLETTEHVFRVGSIGALVHNSCALTRYGADGGHHIFAKSAFQRPSGAFMKGYKARDALCIGNSELRRLGLKHLGADSLTTTQQRLFNELAAGGKAKFTLAEHAEIARKTLIEHGLDPRTAASVVRKAQDQLVGWGIKAPIKIPWN